MMQEDIREVIAYTKQILRNVENFTRELDFCKEQADFLIREYKENKRYFCSEGDEPTIEEIIKTAFEFGWSSRRIFDCGLPESQKGE